MTRGHLSDWSVGWNELHRYEKLMHMCAEVHTRSYEARPRGALSAGMDLPSMSILEAEVDTDSEP